MDPNEIIRPQEEKVVWIYRPGHAKAGQVAPAGIPDAVQVVRTTVYRRDGRVEVWQRNPDQGPDMGVLMPTLSFVDDKIAADYERSKQQAATETPTTRNINGVPHQAGKDEQGNTIWTPVQTANGPATAAANASTAAAAAPGGKPYIDDGPEAGKTGRRWGWNSETRLYDRDLGPSPAAQQTEQSTAGEDRKPLEGYPGVEVVTTVVKGPEGQRSETKFMRGNEVIPDPRPAAEQKPTETNAQGRVPVTGHPGIYLVTEESTKPGQTVKDAHYENEAGQRVELPKPPEKPQTVTRDGKIYEIVPGANGAAPTLREITDPNAKPVEPSGMGATPPAVGKVNEWLWSEADRLAKEAKEKGWTREQYAEEMDRRIKFGTSLINEQTTQQTLQENRASRADSNMRAGLQSSTSLWTSTAPQLIEMGGNMLPGNGMTASRGIAAIMQMAQRYAGQGAANAQAMTTIKPDGTITVTHGTPSTPAVVPAVVPPPPSPAASTELPAVPGVNPAFSPTPTPTPGSTPLPDTSDVMQKMLLGNATNVPEWFSAPQNQPADPTTEVDVSYLDLVGQDDDTWAWAKQEARRRDMAGMA